MSKKRSTYIIDMKEVKCPVCKKIFLHNPSSIYKMIVGGRTKYYCSYTCWRKAGGGNGKKYKG